MRNISRRAALKGATAVAASAVAMTAVTAAASIANHADSELLALADEHHRYVELDDRWYEAVYARMPAHLRNVDSREATRAYLKAALQPDLKAMWVEMEREAGAPRVREKMGALPAITLRGIHAKLRAASRGPGSVWMNIRLVSSAASDLERFIGEGGS